MPKEIKQTNAEYAESLKEQTLTQVKRQHDEIIDDYHEKAWETAPLVSKIQKAKLDDPTELKGAYEAVQTLKSMHKNIIVPIEEKMKVVVTELAERHVQLSEKIRNKIDAKIDKLETLEAKGKLSKKQIAMLEGLNALKQDLLKDPNYRGELGFKTYIQTLKNKDPEKLSAIVRLLKESNVSTKNIGKLVNSIKVYEGGYREITSQLLEVSSLNGARPTQLSTLAKEIEHAYLSSKEQAKKPVETVSPPPIAKKPFIKPQREDGLFTVMPTVEQGKEMSRERHKAMAEKKTQERWGHLLTQNNVQAPEVKKDPVTMVKEEEPKPSPAANTAKPTGLNGSSKTETTVKSNFANTLSFWRNLTNEKPSTTNIESEAKQTEKMGPRGGK